MCGRGRRGLAVLCLLGCGAAWLLPSRHRAPGLGSGRRGLLAWGLAAAAAEGRVAGPIPALPEALSCDGRRLRVLRSVGAGAQGAVFVTEVDGSSPVDLLALKVSQQNTQAAVDKECGILKDLEAAGVPDVVRCVATCFVEVEGGRRQAALLSPYLPDAKQATFTSALAEPLETQRVRSLMRTAAAILDRGVAVSDVQVLQQSSGRLLWIDFTEAVRLDTDAQEAAPGLAVRHPNFQRSWETSEAAALSFVAEVFGLVPAASRPAALSELRASLCRLQGPGALYAKLWAEMPWLEDGAEIDLRCEAA